MAEGGRKVVIGVDESSFAEEAFNFYAENFLKEDDVIILVHTPERYNFVDANLGTQVDRPHVHRELLEEIKQKVETLEDKYSKKMEDCGIRHGKFVKKHGDAGEAIIAVAEKEKANLIVTGCRGMGLLRRTFLGSVSDYVMHHAHCPVLVCRK
ncbi:universal stress protein in QAH/OAS sulfhydrylase 3'region-like isoform X1 [Crassostrea angulata]|uniref:universal stress protein in QAH/OAS sulfhydrylase 3'region-like isoform X1 n=1 Tax=Magallana angulata TaxID=2784310 RepID=UPI0022B0DADF|nr:universal stress protein in QAH/OAS sulfhydrylase 3'region-like isoform X1 [Crassostrea angulata]